MSGEPDSEKVSLRSPVMPIAENGSEERENGEIVESAPAVVARLARCEHVPSVAIIGLTEEASIGC